MTDKTISELMDAMTANMSAVSESGEALITAIKEQTAALNEMKTAAEVAGESSKNIGDGGTIDRNDLDAVSAFNEVYRQQKGVVNYAQSAIDLGNAQYMQTAIDALNEQSKDAKKAIDKIDAQMQSMMKSANPDMEKGRALEKSRYDNYRLISIIDYQVDRIDTEIMRAESKQSSASPPAKTYRMEIKTSSGTKFIVLNSEAEVRILQNALGQNASLVG